MGVKFGMHCDGNIILRVFYAFGFYTISSAGFRIEVSLHGDKGVRRQMEDAHLLLPSLGDLEPAIRSTRNFS